MALGERVMYAVVVNKLDFNGWVIAENGVTYPFYDSKLQAQRACDTFKELFGEDNVKLFQEIEIG